MPLDIYFAKVQISVHLQVDNIFKMAQIQLPGFRVGMAVETSFTAGSTNPSAIDLQKNDNQNIMLHIRVDRDRLVMNTKTNDAWGGEEYFNSIGIGSPGKLLTLRVEAQSDCFHVIINGKDTYNYKYRLPVTDVNMCVISTPDIKYYTVFF